MKSPLAQGSEHIRRRHAFLCEFDALDRAALFRNSFIHGKHDIHEVYVAVEGGTEKLKAQSGVQRNVEKGRGELRAKTKEMWGTGGIPSKSSSTETSDLVEFEMQVKVGDTART